MPAAQGEGPVQAFAERHGVRLREALASAVPATRKATVRVAPKLEVPKPLTNLTPVEDLTA